MTDKEQIIINGVDVSGCLFYQLNFEEDCDVKIKHFCSNWHNSCESSNNSNCYFKQLTRKTQECEELKEKIKAYENLALHIKCPHCNKELDLILDGTEEKISLFDRYRKALEEIEEIVGECPAFDCNAKQILDIINKAKGEE